MAERARECSESKLLLNLEKGVHIAKLFHFPATHENKMFSITHFSSHHFVSSSQQGGHFYLVLLVAHLYHCFKYRKQLISFAKGSHPLEAMRCRTVPIQVNTNIIGNCCPNSLGGQMSLSCITMV